MVYVELVHLHTYIYYMVVTICLAGSPTLLHTVNIKGVKISIIIHNKDIQWIIENYNVL